MEKNFDFLPYLLVLIRKKLFISINFILVCVISVIYSFFIAQKQYMSSITFFPPFENTSISSFLTSLNVGSITSSDIFPEQIVTIFESTALRRKIIDRFDLYKKYNVENSPSRLRDALKKLNNDLAIKTNEVGSFGITKLLSYTISSYHSSPDTCYEMINYTFFLIDSVIQEISTDKGKRNRIFIEKLLEKSKTQLDSIQEGFKEFQIANKAYNISDQVSATIKNYGEVKALMLANEYRIQRLRQDFSDDYPEISSLLKSNRVMAAKLRQIEKNSKPDVFVGLELSTDLIPLFTNFKRDIETQNRLILFLSQELEQAKIKEAQDISLIKQVDPSYRPQYKERPKRLFLMAGIIGIYMFFLLSFLLLQQLYITHIKNSASFHEIIRALRNK